MREFGIQSASELINTITGQYSEKLEDFTIAIFSLVEPHLNFDIDVKNSVVEFVLHNLLQFEDSEEQSKLFNLRLVSPGTNSFKVTMILKSELKVTLTEAKAIISCCPIDIIKKKTKKQLDPILKLIKGAGATAEIVDL
jgi:ribosomal protein L7/L12